MKIKTSELTGAALDWAVAKCQNIEIGPDNMPLWFGPDGDSETVAEYEPSTDWAQGGPIIVSEECWPTRYYGAAQSRGKVYQASAYDGSRAYAQGSTPLIAAMRCYVASKLGDEVDIPEEFIE